MAIAHVQTVGATNLTAAQPTITRTITLTTGNAVVVFVQNDSATGQTCTVSDGTNTYTQQDTSSDGGNHERVTSFVATNVTGGAKTVTATFSGNVDNALIIVGEYSGLATSSLVDQHGLKAAASYGTGTDAVTTSGGTASMTTVSDGDLIVAYAGASNNIFNNQFSAGTGYTRRITLGNGSTGLSGASEDLVQGTHGVITPTFTQANTATDILLAVALKAGAATVTVALTGTVTSSITESDVVAGGKTIILTATGDTYVVAAGGLFDAQRQNIINGCTSAQSETHGWNNEVKAKIAVTDVVRTSNSVVTITLDAEAAYDITATETITVTVPSTAFLLGGGAVVASPTFTVTAAATGAPAAMNYFRQLAGN